jgi:hypothetical protein
MDGVFVRSCVCERGGEYVVPEQRIDRFEQIIPSEIFSSSSQTKKCTVKYSSSFLAIQIMLTSLPYRQCAASPSGGRNND